MEVLSVVLDPYEIVVPYSTCESLNSFVVHATVPAVEVIPDDAMAEMTGGVVSGVAVIEAPKLSPSLASRALPAA